MESAFSMSIDPYSFFQLLLSVAQTKLQFTNECNRGTNLIQPTGKQTFYTLCICVTASAIGMFFFWSEMLIRVIFE